MATLAIAVNSGPTAPAARSNLFASVGSRRIVTLSWSDNASNDRDLSGLCVERWVFSNRYRGMAFLRMYSSTRLCSGPM
jgi:hypothetical protein